MSGVECFIVSCVSPKTVFKSWRMDPDTGLAAYTMRPSEAFAGRSRGKVSDGVGVEVPCGECIKCREAQGREWGIRMVHESKFHEASIILTISYAPDFLPLSSMGYPTLVERHVVLFLKRMRKFLVYECARNLVAEYAKRGESLSMRKALKLAKPIAPKVRYFYAGEYGETNHRPHYHMVLFGVDVDAFGPFESSDRSGAGNAQFESPKLTELWGLGAVWIQRFSASGALYVANYIGKKSMDVARIGDAVPAYARMSNKPGIGGKFYEVYRGQMFPRGSVVVEVAGGAMREVAAPRAYEKRLRLDAPDVFRELKLRRRALMRERAKDSSREDKLAARDRMYRVALERRKGKKPRDAGAPGGVLPKGYVAPVGPVRDVVLERRIEDAAVLRMKRLGLSVEDVEALRK